jgi:hypothetical protein
MTYEMKFPFHLIVQIQKHQQQRNEYEIDSLEWKKYDELFTRDISELAYLFTKEEHKVFVVEKYS